MKELKKQVEDLMTSKFFFEMDGRHKTFVPLTPKQIYDEQLKFKKGKMTENESLYIRETFFANKVLSGYNDNVIFLA